MLFTKKASEYIVYEMAVILSRGDELNVWRDGNKQDILNNGCEAHPEGGRKTRE